MKVLEFKRCQVHGRVQDSFGLWIDEKEIFVVINKRKFLEADRVIITDDICPECDDKQFVLDLEGL